MEILSNIPCAVCEDVFPLVRDGVASAQSEALVTEHLMQCEACRKALTSCRTDAAPQAARTESAVLQQDAAVMKRIQRCVSLWIVALVVGGLALGMGLLFTPRGYLVILVFPLLCGTVCWLDNFAWKLVPPLSSVVCIAVTLLQNGIHSVSLDTILDNSFQSGVQAFVLCLVGALAAKLLKYGFSKKTKERDL